MKWQIKTMRPWAAFLGGLGVAVVILTGCGKKPVHSSAKSDGSANSAQAASNDVATATAAIPRGPAPQAMPAAPASIAASVSADEAAAQLTMELRRYVAYTRSVPKNFEDFVAHHPIKYPPAPAGKKYVIENGKVVVR